jgi:hypothetical protein
MTGNHLDCAKRKNSKSYSYDWHCWHFLSAFRHSGTHWVESFHMSKSSGTMDPTCSCEMPSCWAIDLVKIQPAVFQH